MHWLDLIVNKNEGKSLHLKIDHQKLYKLNSGEKNTWISKKNLRDMWDKPKSSNIHVTESQKEKRMDCKTKQTNKKHQKIKFKEIMAENSPNLAKDINIQIQEAQ